ncbi:2-hydroxychromene-2-carboxylate isomerase [Polymorphobacter multimanifer]|uniref:2-hydroxychromene-2-carboxylate isomerase n=1 Tax=Polymorphobacter multimanifer TaxID=1070431 RepID=A0A841LBS2_9SPHN|nr:2-hydroxychromene-2-carboxylate isomerase [Polymorphobacter multimanifer]MBB6228423.1 2-hydroxychromene-2-carboxylate isomerase [Polymorphobacter multimanifer]GGI74782.1 2-hydroxychromene-2-carboxylate isomerase [Polymorphobacter multimanifer]
MDAQFLFDVGGPNAYFAWAVLPALEARTGVRFAQVPVLLGGLFKLTGNQSPMMAFAGVPAKLAYAELETKRFMARHGLEAFRMNPHFPVNSMLVMRGAVAAGRLGVMDDYVAAMMRGMWEQGLALGDAAVWEAAMVAAGLPAAEIAALVGEPDVKAELVANTEGAAAAGAFGVPSFLLDGELYFGKDRMDEVERVLAG